MLRGIGWPKPDGAWQGVWLKIGALQILRKCLCDQTPLELRGADGGGER